MAAFRKPAHATVGDGIDVHLNYAETAPVVSPDAAAARARNLTPESYTIGAANLQDYVLSPDGHTIYIAGADGVIRAFDEATRIETAAWKVGADLGGIDISADGTTIVAVEDLSPFSKSGSFGDTQSSYQVYTLDLGSGMIAAKLTTVVDYYPEGFFDIAMSSDGQAVLSGDDQWGTLTLLDLDTGAFTGTRTSIYTSTLRATNSHDHIAVLQNGISDAPIDVYTPGKGITASHGNYDDGVQGYNNGVVAIDDTKNLVAQGLGSQVNIYDLRLDFQFNLNTYKSLGLGQVAGLAFSGNGGTLYILDAEHDTIVAVGTKVWEPIANYALGAVDIVGDVYGNGLVASADGSYLTFVAADGLHVVDIAGGAGTYTGNTGADMFAGGAGNDTYYVDAAADTVTEQANAGYDTVRAAIDYTLGDNLEALTLVDGALKGTGNLLANTLIGTNANNVLAGLDGDDHLMGGLGRDTLTGGAGDDVLDGGADGDRMVGGAGNDRYIVDNAADRIVETNRGGYDTVEASVTTTLARGVDALLMTGTAAIAGTGNALANHLVGNVGDNLLSGLAGDDLLEAGGGGIDRMIGGAGADTFRFVQLDASGASYANADSIADFSAADGDRIDLSGMDADVLTAGDQAFIFIGSGAFSGHAGELQVLTYPGDTYLQADLNGDKLIDFVVALDGRVALAATDFAL